MEIFLIVFFVLTILFFLSNKEDTGPNKVLKSIWYTIATIGSVATILGCMAFGFIHYINLQEQKSEIAYQGKLKEEWPKCSERAKVVQVMKQVDYETALWLSNCKRPSGY